MVNEKCNITVSCQLVLILIVGPVISFTLTFELKLC